MNKLVLTKADIQNLEESMKNIVDQDKVYDAKFFARFSKDERRAISFGKPVLVTWEYEDIELPNDEHEKGNPIEVEYSANAGDYFLAGEDHVFKLSTVYSNASFEGINRRVVIKDKPTVVDLEVENMMKLMQRVVGKDY